MSLILNYPSGYPNTRISDEYNIYYDHFNYKYYYPKISQKDIVGYLHLPSFTLIPFKMALSIDQELKKARDSTIRELKIPMLNRYINHKFHKCVIFNLYFHITIGRFF